MSKETLREKIDSKCREVLHTYSMIGLLKGKSPISWDEAYLLEWSDVLADQILNLLKEELEGLTVIEEKEISTILEEWRPFTTTSLPMIKELLQAQKSHSIKELKDLLK